MFELFQYSFFYYSVAISILLSVLFTIISFIIVTKRLSFLAIGTEHAAFGGVGLAQLLKTEHFFTTTIFCVILTVFAGRSHKKFSDIGVSILFSGAMAFGMILLSLDNSSTFNLIGFLFGDILSVGIKEVFITLTVTVLTYIIIIPSINKVLFIIFDRDMAQVSGINVDFWDTILYIILSVGIVLGINLVGVLLVSAMTVLPATFALLFKKNIMFTCIISFIFSLCSMIFGIITSFHLDLAPGALIVILAVIIYFIFKYLLKRDQ